MKTWITALSSAVLGSVMSLTLTGQAQVAKAPSAVAFVSAQRILAESSYGRAETARAQGIQQQRATDLRGKQQALEATRQQLVTSADAAERLALQQKENQQRTELERTAQQIQVELQTLQREVNNELSRRVRMVLDEVMKTQEYQLVLNADTAVFWASPSLDMTNAVVARMNAQ